MESFVTHNKQTSGSTFKFQGSVWTAEKHFFIYFEQIEKTFDIQIILLDKLLNKLQVKLIVFIYFATLNESHEIRTLISMFIHKLVTPVRSVLPSLCLIPYPFSILCFFFRSRALDSWGRAILEHAGVHAARPRQWTRHSHRRRRHTLPRNAVCW